MTRLAGALAAFAVLSVSSVASAAQRWGEQQKLTAPDSIGNDDFGAAVAVSGQTAIVGAPGHGGRGTAYVFVRSGTGWALQQELEGKGNLGNFGASVALQGDTAFVGESGEGGSQGAVHVFVRSGTAWSQVQAIPEPHQLAGGGFGASVALDGTTAVVGAPAFMGTGPGAAYVFVLSGSTWSLQGTLENGSTQSDGLGAAVALSGDTAILGAPNAVAAYVFTRSGTTWSQQQELTPAQGNASFGSGVAVLGDTAVAVTGAVGPGGVMLGFSRSGTTWAQAYDVAPPVMSDGFGGALALRGGTLVVGSPVTTMDGVGQADVYTTAGGSEAHQVTLTSSDGRKGDLFGAAVAIDGTTLVAGASGVEGSRGAAYVFVYATIDGDACASDDACISGHCVDGVCCSVASCPGAGECEAAEHCQPGTGKCSVTPLHAGMPCQSDACTRDATCKGIVCEGTVVVCAPADACHEFGACDPSTGQCSSPAKPDGTACGDGACSGGKCLVLGVQPPPGGCGCGVGEAPAGWAGGAGLALLFLLRRSSRGARGRCRARWARGRR